MQALALVPVVKGATTRLMDSALPDSPVVAAPKPGRSRRLTARLLHRLANRLGGDEPR
jgi:hypothetical protein